MKKFIDNLENGVVSKYGFENGKTILVFKATEIIRKIWKVG